MNQPHPQRDTAMSTPSIAESLDRIAGVLENIDDRLYGIELALRSPTPWNVEIR